MDVSLKKMYKKLNKNWRLTENVVNVKLNKKIELLHGLTSTETICDRIVSYSGFTSGYFL